MVWHKKFNLKNHRCCSCRNRFGNESELSHHHSEDLCQRSTKRFGPAGGLLKCGLHKHGSLTCSFCGQTFATGKNRLRHEKERHIYFRPHKCAVCQKSFPRPFLLENHKKVHKKQLTREDDLKRRQVVHSSKTAISCETCGKTFKNPERLKSHKVVHSEKIFSCDVCGMKTKWITSFKRHLKQHHQ